MYKMKTIVRYADVEKSEIIVKTISRDTDNGILFNTFVMDDLDLPYEICFGWVESGLPEMENYPVIVIFHNYDELNFDCKIYNHILRRYLRAIYTASTENTLDDYKKELELYRSISKLILDYSKKEKTSIVISHLEPTNDDMYPYGIVFKVDDFDKSTQRNKVMILPDYIDYIVDTKPYTFHEILIGNGFNVSCGIDYSRDVKDTFIFKISYNKSTYTRYDIIWLVTALTNRYIKLCEELTDVDIMSIYSLYNIV